MVVTVLGATGEAGRQIAGLLLDEGIDVVACARDQARLRAWDARRREVGAPACTATMVVDVERDQAALARVIEESDVVVGATSRAEHAPVIAELAARAGRSYLGLYLSSRHKWARLRALHDLCLTTGASVVDDAGAHPGIPGALVRLAAARGPLAEAWVGARFSTRWSELTLARDTMEDFLGELRGIDARAFVDGRWVEGFRHTRRFEFGDGVGPATCIPMCLEEIRELPGSIEGLRGTGFFIAGFGPAVDYLVLPASAALGRIAPRLAARVLWWGLKAFEREREYAILVLDGLSGAGAPVHCRVSHQNPYTLTAAPAVATLLQMLDAPRAGVWTQAARVEPVRFFEDLERLGVRVEWSEAAR
jgi:hypothetical protein